MNNKILFMYYNNKIIYLSNSNMDHREWFLSLGGKEEDYDNLIRGFIMDGKIAFYKGIDFKYDSEVIDIAKRYGPVIRENLHNNSLVICCGVLPGLPGQKWEPILIISDKDLRSTNNHVVNSSNNTNVNSNEPIIELKNDYNDNNFIKRAIKVTSIVLVLIVIIKIILLIKNKFIINRLDVMLTLIQVIVLLLVIDGYKKNKDYTKYLSLAAAFLIVLSFNLMDIIVGIYYFLFSVDHSYTDYIIDNINKLIKKIRRGHER